MMRLIQAGAIAAAVMIASPALAQQPAQPGASGEVLGSLKDPAPICTATVTDSCMQCSQAPRGYPGAEVCRKHKQWRDRDDRRKPHRAKRDRD